MERKLLYQTATGWITIYRYKRKRYYVGCYDTELEAAKAYDLTTASIHKNFQRKNYEQ